MRQRLAATEANPRAVNLDLVDLAGPNLIQEFRVLDNLRLAGAHTRQALHDREQDDDYDNEDKDVFGQVIHIEYPRWEGAKAL